MHRSVLRRVEYGIISSMKIRCVIILFALTAVAVGAQIAVAKARPATGPAVAESAFAAFGGFRSIASEIVWFRADRLQDEGRYVELAQLAHALTLSEPHTPEVWSHAAWNLAYNVSVMMPKPEDRWRWVRSALSLLRDEGLKYNPKSAELYKELAMLFEFKLGLDIDDAADHYRAEWKRIVEDVARRNAWSELSMDEKTMEKVEKFANISDRTDPLYSAVYWALQGVPYADRNTGPFLNEIIRQSLAIYARRH